MDVQAPLSPNRTVVTSFTPRRPSLKAGSGAITSEYEDGDWILCLAANPLSATCALSNGEVKVYDLERMHNVMTYAHSSLVTDLRYGPSPSTVVASAQDGSLTVLDLRQESPAWKGSIPPGQSALSVALGFDGYLAAVASSKARIHFLDLRAPGAALLGSYVDAHTDAVTGVEFYSNTPWLLSGAEDGLVCLFDTTKPTEATALTSVMNVGTPLRRVGFCDSDTVWCMTGSETASLWNANTASCIHDFGPSLREQLSMKSSRQVDYVIDGHWDAASRELFLSAGNSNGEAALFRLNDNMSWDHCHWLEGGHRGVVRGVCHVSQSLLLSAGEDARLCEWNRLGSQAHAVSPTNKAGMRNRAVQVVGGGGPVRRGRHRQAATPY